MSTQVVVLTRGNGQVVVDGIGKVCQYDHKDKCTLRCAMMEVLPQEDALYSVTLKCCSPPITYEDVLGEYYDESTDEIEGG